MISVEQVRAARYALRWSVVELSKASSVSTSTIKRLEAESGIPKSTVANIQAIQTSLEAAGIEFIGSPEDRPGIRIGKPRQ